MYEYKFYLTTRDHLSYFTSQPDLLNEIHYHEGRYKLLRKDDNNKNDICVNLDQCLFVAQLEMQKANAMEPA